MDELLTPVITKKSTKPAASQKNSISTAISRHVNDFDDALVILTDSPTAAELSQVVFFLRTGSHDQDVKAVQAANVIVTEIIPDWWPSIKRDQDLDDLKASLLDYLCDITCLGRLVSRLKLLTLQVKSASVADHVEPLDVFVDVLREVLNAEDTISKLYSRCVLVSSAGGRAAAWREIISLLASGRIISIVAEAEDLISRNAKGSKSSWISQGALYCRWLAHNISAPLVDKHAKDDSVIGLPELATLLGKALMLGYQGMHQRRSFVMIVLTSKDELVASLLERLLPRKQANHQCLALLIGALPMYQQRTFLTATLIYLNSNQLSSSRHAPELEYQSRPVIGDCAALIKLLVNDNQNLLDYVAELCTEIEKSILVRSSDLRRLVLVVLSDDLDRLCTMLEKMLLKFGDQLFIKHATIVQQEALAQLIVLCAGRIHRKQPMMLFTVAKSSIQTHGTSNRLKSTSERAQWLGMIVAMFLSELTDKPSSRLIFDDESMRTPQAQSYRRLAQLDDKIGDIQNLRLQDQVQIVTLVSRPAQNPKQASSLSNQVNRSFLKPPPAVQPVSRIIEIQSDEEEEDDEDLIPYAKPDSDPEDSDEDPTLINRDKPKAPVYIRDLISMLRETENYNRHRMALETAATLIRRKATFGKEVSDHTEELLSVLMNMNDTFEMEDFLELRQQSLIALVVAQPRIVAPAIASSIFQGSFSVQQRAAMLTALALGAREIAGHKDSDRTETPKFPSKELPSHLKRIYANGGVSKLESASQQLEQAMVQSLALTAADQLSGPNALKVRTFSSRMEVEKKSKTKVNSNDLAKNVAEWFFLPLLNGWWAQAQSLYVTHFSFDEPDFANAVDSGGRAITFSKYLLPLYLRTLAVLLHAAGPSTLTLPQLTTELWDLLLSIRVNALNSNDVKTLDAILFTFLTLLELNEDKQRLANEHAKELVETQEWAKLVLDQYGSESGQEETEGGKIKMLAAAVVVKCHEIVEKWQRLMLGNMVDF